jgi:hypothetical protein
MGEKNSQVAANENPNIDSTSTGSPIFYPANSDRKSEREQQMPTPYYDHGGITIYHGDCHHARGRKKELERARPARILGISDRVWRRTSDNETTEANGKSDC